MSVNLIWDDILKLHNGKYLNFEEDILFGHFNITNHNDEELGMIKLIKVGAWSHWCLFLNKDCYLSPGCNDEAREMQRILGSQSHKDKFAKVQEAEVIE